MLQNKYETVLRKFEMYYPRYYAQAVDWWGSGRMSIMVRLEDGTVYDYDPMDNSIRLISNYSSNENSMRKAFGINLQKMIPFSGLTKGELAEQAGITSAMLSRYIKGTSTPNVVIARRLANILGCSVDELFDNTYSD